MNRSSLFGSSFFRFSWLCAVLAAAALTVARPAAAQPVAEMRCQAVLDGVPVSGVVQADLWDTGVAVDPREYLPQFLAGRTDLIPGLVRYYGHFQDGRGNLLNFEVFLQRGTAGTGGAWVNGARHRETYIDLVVGQYGFMVYPETGGAVAFTCQA